MKALLVVSLVTAVLGFSEGAMSQEWATPEALRAFGAPGDTIRGTATVKKPSSVKNKKNKKQVDGQPEDGQPDISSTIEFRDDDLTKKYGESTPGQKAKERQHAEAAEHRYQNDVNLKNEQNRKNQKPPAIKTVVNKPTESNPSTLKERRELLDQISYLENNSSINLNCSLREKERRIGEAKGNLANFESDPASYMAEKLVRRVEAAESAASSAESAAHRAEMNSNMRW